MAQIKRVFRIIISYLLLLVPRNKNKIVYGAWFGQKYQDNPKYFFEYMLREHPEKKSIWITKNEDVFKLLSVHGYPCAMSNSPAGIWHSITAGFAVVCCCHDDISGLCLAGSRVINTLHGTPLKHYGKDAIRGKTSKIKKLYEFIRDIPYFREVCVSSGPVVTQIYESAIGFPQKRIWECGLARNDIMSDYLKPDRPKRVVTYMPTHRLEGARKIPLNNILDLAAIDKMCDEMDIIFLVKKHYYHATEIDDIFQYKNIRQITNYQIDPQVLLSISDVLITDYSSCYFDYLMTNNPVIFYCYDMEDYQQDDRELYFKPEDVMPGAIVTDKQELVQAIEQALSNDVFAEDRKRVLDMLYSKECQHNACENMYKKMYGDE